MWKLLPGVASVVAVTFSAGIARAEEPVSRVGVALTLGGGVEEFISAGMRDALGPVGTWELRGTIGTRLPVATEVAYLGSASTPGADGRSLSSRGLELVARVNLRRSGAWRPYAFMGRALRQYRVDDGDGMTSSDQVSELPIGAGCTFHRGALIVDARAALRSSNQTQRVRTTIDGDEYEPMHTWSMTARMGYEF